MHSTYSGLLTEEFFSFFGGDPNTKQTMTYIKRSISNSFA